MASATMDPKTFTRSYAATAYYEPNKGRKNLTVSNHSRRRVIFVHNRCKVLTEAFVSRILFADSEANKEVTATGVEFTHAGKTYTVKANKEVVLSAG